MRLNPLFETTTRYTFEEYRRFSWVLLKKPALIVACILLELLVFVTALLLHSVFLLLFGLFYPVLIFAVQSLQIKKVFASNKVMQNAEFHFAFYADCFVETGSSGQTRVAYEQLDRIIETGKNFYLMIAKNQGFILRKLNFPDGLSDFLGERAEELRRAH